MKKDDGDGFEFNKEKFNIVLAKFQKKQTKANDFLLQAADSYKDATFILFKKFIDTE